MDTRSAVAPLRRGTRRDSRLGLRLLALGSLLAAFDAALSFRVHDQAPGVDDALALVLRRLSWLLVVASIALLAASGLRLARKLLIPACLLIPLVTVRFALESLDPANPALDVIEPFTVAAVPLFATLVTWRAVGRLRFDLATMPLVVVATVGAVVACVPSRELAMGHGAGPMRVMLVVGSLARAAALALAAARLGPIEPVAIGSARGGGSWQAARVGFRWLRFTYRLAIPVFPALMLVSLGLSLADLPDAQHVVVVVWSMAGLALSVGVVVALLRLRHLPDAEAGRGLQLTRLALAAACLVLGGARTFLTIVGDALPGHPYDVLWIYEHAYLTSVAGEWLAATLGTFACVRALRVLGVPADPTRIVAAIALEAAATMFALVASRLGDVTAARALAVLAMAAGTVGTVIALGFMDRIERALDAGRLVEVFGDVPVDVTAAQPAAAFRTRDGSA